MFNETQNIGDKNPFKVPENYFADFKKDIMFQIASQTPEKPVSATLKISIWKRTISWSAAAAAFIGIVFTLNTTLRNPQQITQNEQHSQEILASSRNTEEADFYQYIEEQSTRGSFNETLLNEEYTY